MAGTDDFEKLEVRAEAELWSWLERHHATDRAVWLVTWKAARRDRYVSCEAVLDALVAYGWTDGRRRKLDDARTMQLISPRRQPVWAQSYKDRAARLLEEGRMHAAGLAAIKAAKAAGVWEASAEVDALIVPEDLARALDASGGAGWFDRAAPSYRRNVLRWIAGAKRAPTRAKRVAELARRCGLGQKVPQY